MLVKVSLRQYICIYYLHFAGVVYLHRYKECLTVQARTRKQFNVVNEPEKAPTIVHKILFNFIFINPTLRPTAMQH